MVLILLSIDFTSPFPKFLCVTFVPTISFSTLSAASKNLSDVLMYDFAALTNDLSMSPCFTKSFSLISKINLDGTLNPE